MKKILSAFLIFQLSVLAFNSSAQVPYPVTKLPADAPQWEIEMFKPGVTPDAVADLYEQYYATHDFVKNFYTQYYKHWMMKHARDNDGALFNLPLDENKFSEQKYLQNTHQHNLEKASVWQCIGPIDFDHHAASTSYAPGAAHVYTAEQSFSDPNTLYAGTANAGVWKSIDKGENWTNLTKDMMLSQVRALEIDFTDPNIIYFSGGGKIYKSIDGGSSWNATGSVTFQSAFVDANDIMMSTINHNELWAATGTGLWYTNDGGTNWNQLMSGVWQELEVKPNDINIMYAIKQTGVKTEFYKSTDAGQTFTIRLGGYPVALSPNEQKRTEITVTPAAPNIVYAFCTGVANAGSGLYGIYVSHDAGENWNFQCCGTGPGGVPDTGTNKNLCGWDDKGGDDGGQYYYDLAMAASPFDSNEIHIGAVNHWVSYDAGVNWNCPAKWSHSDKPNYVHADIHDIHFYNNNWWISCDGGIFYSASLGDTFTKNNMELPELISGVSGWVNGMEMK